MHAELSQFLSDVLSVFVWHYSLFL